MNMLTPEEKAIGAFLLAVAGIYLAYKIVKSK